MTVRSSPPRCLGFTLLELVVVLAIGALLLGTMGSVFSGVVDVARKALIDGTEQDEVAIVQRFVQALLKATVPPTTGDEASKFQGMSNELSFRSVPPESLLPFGELRFRLYVAANRSGAKSLFLDANSDPRISGDLGIRLERYQLLGNVREIGFRYFDNAGSGRIERVDWTDQSRLPALIRIVISRENNPPLEIDAAPRRNVNGRCRYDQIALTCRG